MFVEVFLGGFVHSCRDNAMPLMLSFVMQGRILFKEGEPLESVYLLSSGTVAVSCLLDVSSTDERSSGLIRFTSGGKGDLKSVRKSR